MDTRDVDAWQMLRHGRANDLEELRSQLQAPEEPGGLPPMSEAARQLIELARATENMVKEVRIRTNQYDQELA